MSYQEGYDERYKAYLTWLGSLTSEVGETPASHGGKTVMEKWRISYEPGGALARVEIWVPLGTKPETWMYHRMYDGWLLK